MLSLLSRAKPEMLIALMKKEIPEISEEIIEIKARHVNPVFVQKSQ